MKEKKQNQNKHPNEKKENYSDKKTDVIPPPEENPDLQPGPDNPRNPKEDF